jgi:hypothetical protein
MRLRPVPISIPCCGAGQRTFATGGSGRRPTRSTAASRSNWRSFPVANMACGRELDDPLQQWAAGPARDLPPDRKRPPGNRVPRGGRCLKPYAGRPCVCRTGRRDAAAGARRRPSANRVRPDRRTPSRSPRPTDRTRLVVRGRGQGPPLSGCEVRHVPAETIRAVGAGQGAHPRHTGSAWLNRNSADVSVKDRNVDTRHIVSLG